MASKRKKQSKSYHTKPLLQLRVAVSVQNDFRLLANAKGKQRGEILEEWVDEEMARMGLSSSGS